MRLSPGLRAPLLRSAAAVALAGLGASPALAQSKAQYRQLQLTDGRNLTAEVVSTEATGLLMLTPQGKSLIPFELLLDMIPTDQSVYDNQSNWIVHVAGDPAIVPAVLGAFQAIPAVQVLPASQSGAGITPAQASTAHKCGADIECVTRTLTDGTWRWVVVATPEDDGGVKLVSAVTTGSTRIRAAAPSTEADALWKAVHEAILLQPPTAGPPRHVKGGATPSPRPTPARDTDAQGVMAMSFTPVPGLPSLRQGDTAGFATALGIVVPSTALWVGAVGQNAQSVPEAALLSVAGFYAATVVANQVTGMQSMKKSRRKRR